MEVIVLRSRHSTHVITLWYRPTALLEPTCSTKHSSRRRHGAASLNLRITKVSKSLSLMGSGHRGSARMSELVASHAVSSRVCLALLLLNLQLILRCTARSRQSSLGSNRSLSSSKDSSNLALSWIRNELLKQSTALVKSVARVTVHRLGFGLLYREVVRDREYTYLVLDVDGFTTRLKE